MEEERPGSGGRGDSGRLLYLGVGRTCVRMKVLKDCVKRPD